MASYAQQLPPPPLPHQPYSTPGPMLDHAGHPRRSRSDYEPHRDAYYANPNPNILAPHIPAAAQARQAPPVQAPPPAPAAPLLLQAQVPVPGYTPAPPLAPTSVPASGTAGTLLPSAAIAQMPAQQDPSRPESIAGSHHSGRSRRSRHSHHSYHSHHKTDTDTKDDKRPTLGDTLMLMWDTVWGSLSPRRK